jgi:hypothetical protein
MFTTVHRKLCWILTACYTRDICTHNSAACVSGNIKVEVLNQIMPVIVHIKHALKNLHTSWHQGAHGALLTMPYCTKPEVIMNQMMIPC